MSAARRFQVRLGLLQQILGHFLRVDVRVITCQAHAFDSVDDLIMLRLDPLELSLGGQEFGAQCTGAGLRLGGS